MQCYFLRCNLTRLIFTYSARGSHIMITYTRKNHFVENYVCGGHVRDPIGVILKNHGGHWQKEWHQESIWKRVPTDKRLIAAMKKIKIRLILIVCALPVRTIKLLWPFWPLKVCNGQGGQNWRLLKIWRIHELYDQNIEMIKLEFEFHSRDSQNIIWVLPNVIGEQTNRGEL